MSDTNDKIRESLLKALLPDTKAVTYLLAGCIAGYVLGRVFG